MLFLQSPANHFEILDDLYMNEAILSVPWHSGREYRLTWDTSVLPNALEKSAICHSIVKTDQRHINLFKMAWIKLDGVYPGSAKNVVNLISLLCFRNHSQPRQVAASAATTGAANTAGALKFGFKQKKES